MNPGSKDEARRLAGEVIRFSKKFKNIAIVLAPPFVFLHQIPKVKLGAQDLFWENSQAGGAFTGEISAKQLKSLGVSYVIVGHSERRAMGETNEIVNKKLNVALEAGLKAVLCIGERERKKDEMFPAIVREELHSAIF